MVQVVPLVAALLDKQSTKQCQTERDIAYFDDEARDFCLIALGWMYTQSLFDSSNYDIVLVSPWVTHLAPPVIYTAKST